MSKKTPPKRPRKTKTAAQAKKTPAIKATEKQSPGKIETFFKISFSRFFSQQRKILLLRLILPALTIGAVVLLVITQAPNILPQRLNQSPAQPLSDIQDASYSGTSRQGHDFSIESRAVFGDSNENFSLSEPIITIWMKDSNTIEGTSQMGYYNEQDQVLQLRGDVVIDRNAASRLHGEAIDILIDSGDLASDQMITGSGEFGLFFGQGFRSMNAGRLITITGPAWLSLSSR
ncbi:MAG: LPS export ABC transporter periplasmic protein LptC [Pseudomonadota bacterium]